MKLGIIDLGTNTFNLLIVEYLENANFRTIYNTKSIVMLGKEGINEGYISKTAFDRAFGALRKFREYLNFYHCDKIIAFGTSAIRSASNANDFIEKVENELQIQIQPISGDQEAQYIYHGVKHSVRFTDENYLILDIGGGSNEFIIANKDKLLWKHSFPLGGARLLDKFSPEDPISNKTIEKIHKYLESELELLKNALKQYPVTKLVGASGAFDSFTNIISFSKTNKPLSEGNSTTHLSLPDFKKLYQKITFLNRSQRLLVVGLDEFRVDSIVIALIFTNFSINLSNINEILHSTYSLKEGVAVVNGLTYSDK